MWLIRSSVAITTCACLLVDSAVAQTTQRFSIQGSVLYAGLFGEEFEGLGNGAGFEVQGRYTPSLFSVGAGFQYTNHGASGDFEGADFTLAGGFVEPRYVFPTHNDKYAPYVSARVSILRESLKLDGAHASATGFTGNVGGGVLFRLSTRVNLDLGATAGYTKFGERTGHDQFGGELMPSDGQSGSNILLRLGVAVGIGG